MPCTKRVIKWYFNRLKAIVDAKSSVMKLFEELNLLIVRNFSEALLCYIKSIQLFRITEFKTKVTKAQ